MNLPVSHIVRYTVTLFVLCCLSTLSTAQEDTQDNNISVQLRTFLEGAITQGVCGRTQLVQAEILDEFNKTRCQDITDEELASINSLELNFSGQFSDLRLSALSAGDFDGLTTLHTLTLTRAETETTTSTLPINVFSELSSLEVLRFSNFRIPSLSAGDFDGLTGLLELGLRASGITVLPPNVFSGLSNLQKLDLHSNSLGGGLQAGVFNGLGNLQVLDLGSNALSTLPAGIFSGLSSLRQLLLAQNTIGTLASDTFAGLNQLTILDLSGNSLLAYAMVEERTITIIPFRTFDLPALEELNLTGNELGTDSFGDTYCSNLGDFLRGERDPTDTVTVTEGGTTCEIEIDTS